MQLHRVRQIMDQTVHRIHHTMRWTDAWLYGAKVSASTTRISNCRTSTSPSSGAL